MCQSSNYILHWILKLDMSWNKLRSIDVYCTLNIGLKFKHVISKASQVQGARNSYYASLSNILEQFYGFSKIK